MNRYRSDASTNQHIPKHRCYTDRLGFGKQFEGGKFGVAGIQAVEYNTQVGTEIYSRHDPEGWNHIVSKEEWERSRWNGKVLCNYDLVEKPSLMSYLWPGGNLLGLWELYDSLKPFSDVKNPTVEEVDKWNLAVIRHFRSLFMIDPPPIEPDLCLYVFSQWNNERQFSDCWDEKYKKFGQDHNQFFPGMEVDRQPYLSDMKCDFKEGFTALLNIKTQAPWFIKMSHILFELLSNTDPHKAIKSLLAATKIGMSFHVLDNAHTVCRIRWI
jgi:hypothetical protein